MSNSIPPAVLTHGAHHVATVRAVGTVVPRKTPVIVCTLVCGHEETRLRVMYPHWQEGDAPPVRWLICRECSRDD